jgi:hypothetical protein
VGGSFGQTHAPNSGLIGPKPLCRSCRYLEIRDGKMGKEYTTLDRCSNGVPGELDKKSCPAYQREPGSDDE